MIRDLSGADLCYLIFSADMHIGIKYTSKTHCLGFTKRMYVVLD